MTSDPFDGTTYCTARANAECDQANRCDPSIIDWSFGSLARCKSAQRALCLAEDAPFLSALIGQSVIFSQAQYATCMSEITGLACGAAPGLSAACDAMFRGARNQNAGCAASIQCADGLFCSGLATGVTCGSCQPTLNLGSVCTYHSACGPSARCIAATAGATSGTCQALSDLYKPAGQVCNTQNGPACQGYLVCSGATASNPAGTCTAIELLAGGAACSATSDIQRCISGQQCVVPTAGDAAGTCTALPGSGTACDLDRGVFLCADPYYCSAWETNGVTAGTCNARKTAGGSCTAAETAWAGNGYKMGFLACYPDLYCDPDAAGTNYTCTAPQAPAALPACP
ncbi:MAG: hypothetical protein HY904_21195 [Deltaproteobacteria bacterium]|nr:hypothetical protein [Deltaproteobacteria bacterium]